MKRLLVIYVLTIISLALAACDSDAFEYESRYDASRTAWLEFKAASDNSYTYTTRRSSWLGAWWETTIAVENGKVVRRSFKLTYQENGVIVPDQCIEWTESGSQIDSEEHKNTGASEAITLDAVYDKARRDWLKKRGKTTFFFETKNDGMISLCGYAPNGCADDCFVGISILSIEPAV